MSLTRQYEGTGGMLKLTIAGAAATTGGGIGSILNPEGVDLLIIRTFLYARTGSTGAANLGVGIGATATTSATDILSSFDGIEATIGSKAFYCQAVSVNETQEAVVWEDDEYLTVTGSATTVGLDADLYVEYIRLA